MDQAVRRVRGEELKAQWRARLGRFADAKQSVRAFCASEAVSEPTFFHWRRRLGAQAVGALARARTKPAGFFEVGVARVRPTLMRAKALPVPSQSSVEVQIDLGAGVVLRILRR